MPKPYLQRFLLDRTQNQISTLFTIILHNLKLLTNDVPQLCLIPGNLRKSVLLPVVIKENQWRLF
jgi:hypothetical protein